MSNKYCISSFSRKFSTNHRYIFNRIIIKFNWN